MVVRKIHQIWLQGESKLPAKYGRYSQMYQDINIPYGWSYKLWDDKQIRKLIKNNYPSILICIYDNYPFWVMRVDLAKYCILNHEGGLIIDMDTRPKQSFEKLIPMTQNRPTFLLQKSSKTLAFLASPLNKTNNHFLYFPTSRHPLTELLIKRAQCTYERMPWDIKIYYILGSIGPIFLLDTIREYGEEKVTWIDTGKLEKFFDNEAENSWNKRSYDGHDIFWISIFVLMLVLAIYSVYTARRIEYLKM